jgi:hypothetical protein
VGVGAADPERGDPGAARPVLAGHGPRARSAAAPSPADQSTCGDGSVGVQRGGQFTGAAGPAPSSSPRRPRRRRWVCPMLDFTDPSHSGRPSAGPARRRPAGPAPRSGRRARSRSRAPPPRPRRRATAGAGQRRPDHPLLRRPVRRGQPVRRPVLVHRAARTTASTRCPLRRASDSRSSTSMPAPSPQPVPSAAALRTPCTGRRRQPAAAGRTRRTPGGGHHRHAAGQRQRALARPQRLAGQVQGHQRGRARRVHRDRRALEAERVGDPPGDHAGRVAGHPVTLCAVFSRDRAPSPYQE